MNFGCFLSTNLKQRYEKPNSMKKLPSNLTLFLFFPEHRGQQERIRAWPQRHPPFGLRSPADVPGPQSGPSGPWRPAHHAPHSRPSQPTPRATPGRTPTTPRHPAPSSIQIPNHLRTLPGSQNPSVPVSLTEHQKPRLPPSHEPSHGQHVLCNECAV